MVDMAFFRGGLGRWLPPSVPPVDEAVLLRRLPTLIGAVLLHEKITLLGAAGILLILSSLLLPHLMKGKKSHEIQGDPV